MAGQAPGPWPALDLPAPEAAALAAIARGRRAWTTAAALTLAGHDAETLARLVAAGLVEPCCIDAPSYALTPYGLHLARREVREHCESVEVVDRAETVRTTEVRDGRPVTVRRRKVVTHREPTLVPHYAEPDAPEGSPELPKYRRDAGLPVPGWVPDPRLGPAEEAIAREEEFLEDEFTGEPLKIQGVKVKRDPRIKPAKPGGKQ
jgi:hypothetical protein